MTVALQALYDRTVRGGQFAVVGIGVVLFIFMSLESWPRACSSHKWRASSACTNSSKTVLLYKLIWGFHHVSQPAPCHHPHRLASWLPQSSHPPANQLPKPSLSPISFPKSHPSSHNPINFLKSHPPSHLPVWFPKPHLSSNRLLSTPSSLSPTDWLPQPPFSFPLSSWVPKLILPPTVVCHWIW
jgi:hypothetical protein